MVNTFILTNSPKECVKLLDYRRLVKQRLESKQIIDAIEKNGKIGWINHPITKMWKSDVIGLKYYFNCCVDEWVSRGYKNTMVKYELGTIIEEKDILPWFYFNKQIQESFKASLLRKDPKYYKDKINCEEEYMNHGYIWLGNLTKNQIENMRNGIVLKLEDICEDFGTGVPAQYRISKELCQKWVLDKTKNPLTGRLIKESGNVYKDYNNASKFYKVGGAPPTTLPEKRLVISKTLPKTKHELSYEVSLLDKSNKKEKCQKCNKLLSSKSSVLRHQKTSACTPTPIEPKIELLDTYPITKPQSNDFFVVSKHIDNICSTLYNRELEARFKEAQDFEKLRFNDKLNYMKNKNNTEKIRSKEIEKIKNSKYYIAKM